ncbi:hypothetical protein QYF36_004520 [Acer negundo]|nr:hypothetical protein QYF36_004520 [Acer negundo]
MSSVNIKEIPDDILTGILIRLPLKSILRCKSVSKQWRSLISSPLFCRCLYPDPYLVSGLLLHKDSLINKKYDFVSLSDKPTSPPFKTLTFVNHPFGVRILQSCHGLLFCSDYIDRHYCYIYNPTTEQFRRLPRPGGQDLTIVCEIYSSETRSWRLSGRSFIADDGVDFRRGVFWNGAVHWVNCFGPSLYFKVDDEVKVRKMPMPATPIPVDWDNMRSKEVAVDSHVR